MGHRQRGVVCGCECVFLFGFKRESNARKGKVSERRVLHKYGVEEGTLI